MKVLNMSASRAWNKNRQGACQRGRVLLKGVWWHTLCAVVAKLSANKSKAESLGNFQRTKTALCHLLLLFYITASLWGKTTVNQFHQLLLQQFTLCVVLSIVLSRLIIQLCSPRWSENDLLLEQRWSLASQGLTSTNGYIFFVLFFFSHC